MATATTKLHTDATVFAFTDSPGTGAGSWSTNSNTSWNGGTAKVSGAAGDKVTITWTGRALYLLGVKFGSGCDVTITTDGATRSVPQSSYDNNPNSVFRFPMRIETGLTDGAHTTVLQVVASSGNVQFMVNGTIAITGTRSAVTTGVYDACGDSWAFGSGTAANTGYAYVTRRRVSMGLGRDLTFNQNGVSGAGLANKPTTNALNAIEQLSIAATHQPEFLTVMFGVNDLATANGYNMQNPGLFADAWRTTLQFTADLFDTTATTIAVGTPGYVSPAFRWTSKQVAGGLASGFTGGLDNYELAVNAARQVFSEFPWVRVADVYAAMDRRTSLVYPNGNSDLGLHPNAAGHQVVAEEFIHALLAPTT